MYDISLRGTRFSGVALSGSPRLIGSIRRQIGKDAIMSVKEHEGLGERWTAEDK